jgi:hypothetical protein
MVKAHSLDCPYQDLATENAQSLVKSHIPFLRHNQRNQVLHSAEGPTVGALPARPFVGPPLNFFISRPSLPVSVPLESNRWRHPTMTVKIIGLACRNPTLLLPHYPKMLKKPCHSRHGRQWAHFLPVLS